MSKNQNKQAIFGGFRNQVGLQFFAGKNRMTEIEERLAAIRTEMDADGADLDALSAEKPTVCSRSARPCWDRQSSAAIC